MSHLGKLIKALRDSRALTQQEVVDRFTSTNTGETKLDKSFLSRYENGGISLSEAKAKDILVYGFNMSPSDAEEKIKEYQLKELIVDMDQDKVRELLNQDQLPDTGNYVFPRYSSVDDALEGKDPDTLVDSPKDAVFVPDGEGGQYLLMKGVELPKTRWMYKNKADGKFYVGALQEKGDIKYLFQKDSFHEIDSNWEFVGSVLYQLVPYTQPPTD